MFDTIAILCFLGTFVEALSSVRQSDPNNNSLSPKNNYCQSLCGSNNMSECGRFGSYCKPFGPPEDGVGVCQGFYYLPDNTTCFFNTHPDPSVCPEDRPVFCSGNTTTTPTPTSTPEPGPTTTAEPGPTTTAEPGPTTTAEPDYCQSLCGSNNMSDCGRFGSYCKPFGPPEDGVGVCQGFYYLPDNTTCFFNTHPDPAVCPEDRPVFCGGNTTTTSAPTSTPEPFPTTTTEPWPTTATEPGPTTTTEPWPTTATEPGPTTTTEPWLTTATEPGPTTTTEPWPTTATEPGLTTTPEPARTTTNEPGATTSAQPTPTTTTEPAPTTTTEPGPTTSAEPGPTTTAEPGPIIVS